MKTVLVQGFGGQTKSIVVFFESRTFLSEIIKTTPS